MLQSTKTKGAMTKEVDALSTRRATVFRARLRGFNEVPPIFTRGRGSFEARLVGNTLRYRLRFSNLTTRATAAHIHFGQRGVNGEIIAFLCGGGGKPRCGGRSGTITGTIRPRDILRIRGQGLSAGNFRAALRILRSGVSYVNVHSTRFPAGEIRGQVIPVRSSQGRTRRS